MIRLLVTFCLLLAPAAAAQDAKPQAQPQPPQPQWSDEDISGMYTFLKDGEYLQLNVYGGKLVGYVSRLGDDDSNRDAVLDHFFFRAALKGQEVSFTTKRVHGTWFEFSGRVERGKAATRGEDGYFVLKGKLTRFRESADKKVTASAREVEFLSLPEDALADAGDEDPDV